MPKLPPKSIDRYSWMIDAGRLRNQVQLASPSASQDSFGQRLTTWTPYLTAWAEIRHLSGQELFQGDEFTSASQVRITLRWPGPTTIVRAGDRVLFGTHTYVVQIIDNIEMRDLILELTCLEIDGSS